MPFLFGRLRRLLGGAAVFLLLFGAFLVRAQESASLQMVSLGDSIARGYGCRTEEAYGWILADALRERTAEKGIGVSYHNCGVDGQTSVELLESVRSPEMEALLSRADILTISIGGNDLLQFLGRSFQDALGLDPVSPTPGADFLRRIGEGGGKELGSVLYSLLERTKSGAYSAGLDKAAAAYQSNMVCLLDSLFALNPDVTLLLTTIPNPAVGTWMEETADRLLQRFNEGIRSGFGEARVLVADCAQAFQAYEGEEPLSFTCLDWAAFPSWSVDPHPTPAGHRLMAEQHLLLAQDAAAAKADTMASPPPSVPAVPPDGGGGGGRSFPAALLLLPAGILAAAALLILAARKRRRRKP